MFALFFLTWDVTRDVLLRHTRAHVLGDASSDPEVVTSSCLAEETSNSAPSNVNQNRPRTESPGRSNSMSSRAGSNSGQGELSPDVANHITLQNLPSSPPVQQVPLGAFAASTGNEASYWTSECGLENTRDIGVESIPGATSLPSDAFQPWLCDFDARFMTVGSITTFPDLTGEMCRLDPESDVLRQEDNKTRQSWAIRPRRIAPMIHTLWQDISSCSNTNLLSQTDQIGAGTLPRIHPDGAYSLLEKLRRLTARVLGCGCGDEGSMYTLDDGTSTGDHNIPSQSQPSQICRSCESAAKLFRLGLDQYKRRFQATIPIVHIPTFCPEDIPSTLLLVICLLGLTFVNSEEATALVSRAFPVS